MAQNENIDAMLAASQQAGNDLFAKTKAEYEAAGCPFGPSSERENVMRWVHGQIPELAAKYVSEKRQRIDNELVAARDQLAGLKRANPSDQRQINAIRERIDVLEHGKRLPDHRLLAFVKKHMQRDHRDRGS